MTASTVRRVAVATLVAAACGCSDESKTYNALFYHPDGREEPLGQVTGLSACQRAANRRAQALNLRIAPP